MSWADEIDNAEHAYWREHMNDDAPSYADGHTVIYTTTCAECFPLGLTPAPSGAQWCSHRGWHEVTR